MKTECIQISFQDPKEIIPEALATKDFVQCIFGGEAWIANVEQDNEVLVRMNEIGLVTEGSIAGLIAYLNTIKDTITELYPYQCYGISVSEAGKCYPVISADKWIDNNIVNKIFEKMKEKKIHIEYINE